MHNPYSPLVTSSNLEIMTISDSISLSKNWLQIFVYLLLFCSACETPFKPDLGSIESVLVIEGAITDLPGPYTINLSFSSGIYSIEQQAVANAIVKVVEEGGEQETLTETQQGTYITSVNGIQGATGNRYKLSIQLEDGTQYESEYQELPSSISIDSVVAEVDYQYLSIEQPDVPGYQFYVSTTLADNNENYFLWSMESTYEYRTDFTIDYVYEDGGVQVFPNPLGFMTCWRTDQINEIYTFNTEVLSQPKVEQLPINFARADQRELYIRYSLLVKQFTINKAAYTFWNNIQQQIESQETLYNNQPFQIRGNLFNLDDPKETVLGFFMVAAQNEKRIFVDPPPGLDLQRTFCTPDYMSYGLISLFPEATWPIYIYEDESGVRALAPEECFDCRELGGTLLKPEFWEE